jgi:alkaline phosphatase
MPLILRSCVCALVAVALSGCVPMAGRAPAVIPARNVILMIGDGMGPQQVGLLLDYARRAPGSSYSGGPAALERAINAGVLGWVRPFAPSALVVDSAAAASQLAIGVPAASESIGLDAAGRPAPTVLERARAAGFATGLVSDTRMTHATPGAFGAHAAHRSHEPEIAADLLEAAPDLMLSGGWRWFLPAHAPRDPEVQQWLRTRDLPEGDGFRSARRDGRNLLAEAEQAGYRLVFDRQALTAAPAGPLLGLFAPSAMSDAIRAAAGDPAVAAQPTLAEMTRAALERLSADPQGFFLMIEGGQIDWAGHANDAGWLLAEMRRFDAAVAAVLDWTAGRDDTLVVITADHETGGFGFSYSGTGLPSAAAGDTSPTGVLPNFNFGAPALLDRLAGQTTTYGHLLRGFAALPTAERTPARLVDVVRDRLGWMIDEAAAARVLADEPNTMRVAGHPYLDRPTAPRIDDFDAFHVYIDDRRSAGLARALAAEQSVVWASGTHTSTPVPLIAIGPQGHAARFHGIRTLDEVGRLTVEALLGRRE